MSNSWKTFIEDALLRGADRIELTFKRQGETSFRVNDDCKGGFRVGLITEVVDGKSRRVADIQGTIENIDSVLEGYYEQTEYVAFKLRCFKYDVESEVETYISMGKTVFPIEGVRAKIKEAEEKIPSIQVLQTSLTFAAQALKNGIDAQKQAFEAQKSQAEETRLAMREITQACKSIAEISRVQAEQNRSLHDENLMLKSKITSIQAGDTGIASKFLENGGPAIPALVGAVVRSIGKAAETGSFSEAGKELATAFAEEHQRLLFDATSAQSSAG